MTVDDVKLYHGDCLEIMAELQDGSSDMILTDPPYGTTACKWDSIIPLEPMWEQLRRLIKPNGVIVMTASQPFTTTLIASNMKMFKYCWVWDKNTGANFMNLKNRPWKVHEDVCVFAKNAGFTFNPIRCDRTASSLIRYKKGIEYHRRAGMAAAHYGIATGETEHKVNSDGKRHPIDILKISREEPGCRNGEHHPTQKPVALMEYLIKTYTNEGETVLDFAMGSGTTGVACKNLKREFIGIELDDKYFQIARERITAERTRRLFT